MKKIAFALVLSALAAPAFAAFSSRDRGTAAAPFLNFGAGARAAAVGTAHAAVADGPFALQWNTAGLAERRAFQADVMHADWLESASYNVAGIAVPMGESSVFGLSVQQFSVDDLAGADEDGFEESDFSPEDTAATLAWARKAGDGIKYGVAGKFIRSKIVDSASTFAFDAGIQSPEVDGWRWGAAAANLGGSLKYDQKKETLPVIVTVGGSKTLGRTLLLSDLKFPRNNSPYLALGAEVGLGLGAGWQGVGRVGYNTRTGSDLGGSTGVSAGLGLSAGWMSIDYAFAPFGDLGSLHLFSLSVRGADRSRP